MGANKRYREPKHRFLRMNEGRSYLITVPVCIIRELGWSEFEVVDFSVRDGGIFIEKSNGLRKKS